MPAQTPEIKPYPKIEEEIQAFWEREKIFEASVKQRSETQRYTFYDGPPFATGTPHYGHLVPSLIKDMVPRFWTMKGKRVERRWGWDCHGLPIENLVEKELKLRNRKEILAYGVDRFNASCESKILTYASEWKKTISRYGRWVDMDHAYKTMDPEFMESVWWVFKSLWQQGFIYEGRKAMHICPRCETVLSNFEVAENYQDVDDPSVIVSFPLEEDPSTSVLAWTTTPWTLPGNVLLAIHPTTNYAKVKSGDRFFILAKDRIDEVFKDRAVEIVEEVSPASLIQKRYVPLFPFFAKWPGAFRIVQADFVTTDEGTGVVHIAPGFGEEDAELGQREGVGPIVHVRMNGTFTDEVKGFEGKSAKASDLELMETIKKNDRLFKQEIIRHSYPHCWRCDTPLLNYTTTSWFVNVAKLKAAALESAKSIEWMPKHVKEGRFGRWLADAKDWSISRSRYWGTPIPIWRNVDDPKDILCVGSMKELESASGQKITNLHKHIIDPMVIQKDGKTYRRIDEVLDCWFESGSMPYAQKHYPFEHAETFLSQFPADFIAESQDQTTRWFYVLHVIASALTMGEKPVLKLDGVKPAFRHVIVNGMVLAEDGKKMSKRLNNYPEPDLMFEKYGADAVRYYLATSAIMTMDNLNFSEKGVDEIYKKLILLTRNVLSYQQLLSPSRTFRADPVHVLDQWVLYRLYKTAMRIEEGYQSYDLMQATRPLEDFIADLSTWYVRRSRDRLKAESPDGDEARGTFDVVLRTLAKLMAPVMPFLAEHLFRTLGGEGKSVHLCDWPSLNHETITWTNEKEKLGEQMTEARSIVSQILNERIKANLPVRQPLASVKVYASISIPDELKQIILEEVNVRSLTWKDQNTGCELDTTLTPELQMEGIVRSITRAINAQRKARHLTITDHVTICWSSDDPLVRQAIQNSNASLQHSVVADAFNPLASEQRETAVKAQIHGSPFYFLIQP